jgi:hypothetical protein
LSLMLHPYLMSSGRLSCCSGSINHGRECSSSSSSSSTYSIAMRCLTFAAVPTAGTGGTATAAAAAVAGTMIGSESALRGAAAAAGTTGDEDAVCGCSAAVAAVEGGAPCVATGFRHLRMRLIQLRVWLREVLVPTSTRCASTVCSAPTVAAAVLCCACPGAQHRASAGVCWMSVTGRLLSSWIGF